MVMLRNIIVAIVVVAAAVMAVVWFFQSDEARIKKRFKTIATEVSKAPDEHELKAAAGARKIGSLFADSCWIEIPGYNISRAYDREEIPGRVMGARSRYAEISLKFHDIDIRFPDRTTARVVSTVHVEAVRLSGQPVREVHEIDCRLEKIENAWYFNHIEVVPVLER